MFIAPRPSIDDDPLFAVRVAFMPLIGLSLAMALRSPLAMVYPTLMFSLLAGNRKAFDPKRVFGAPIIFSAMLWLMSGVVIALQGVPLALVVTMGVIYFLAFYLIQRTGNALGMLIIVAAALMTIMGLGSYPSMIFLRNEMTKAALLSALVVPVLYALLPTRTQEINVDHYSPAFSYGWGRRAAIRTGVMLAYSLYLYTILDFSNVMLAVAGMFVLVHSTRRSLWVEAGQRSFSVVLGGCLALSVLAILNAVGHLAVLFGLVFLITLWLGNKMLTGRLPSMAYQDAASVIALVGSALASSEPGFAFMQRACLTVLGALAAALLVTILDEVLIKENSEPSSFTR
ncbi:hypothetical protein GCM10007989_16430 [Devosia pacifica]|uniref:Integral membrane bound transporter domain-containing protein n=1 Tax=Devosia pacifica TaxID=1335967 RepID=A0A918S3F3_9HYPH|nr:FUSC family protein [Devosia pacifica]GHA21808.1 hypothetical protein GCM10007989_16430 [Devosia pacifica]